MKHSVILQRTIQACVFVIASGIFIAHTGSALAATCTSSRDYCVTSNPFYQSGYGGQCTAYAWGRAYERFNINLSPRGHAGTWVDSTVTDKSTGKVLSVDKTVRADSIAVWKYGAYGHVAYVENVANGIVYFTESNWNPYSTSGYGKGYQGQRSLSVANFETRGNYKIAGYIHLSNSVPRATISLKTPASNITGVSPTNVAFSWSSQNATNHRLVLSTTSNFSGFVDAGGSSYCSNTSTCWTTTTGTSRSSTWNLASGKTYYWKVRASGSGGDVWSSVWNLTTASATAKPVAPTSLSASASGTSITLRWNDVSSNESGFRLYRWNGSQWTSLTTTAANATSYNNSGLSSNTTYYYTACSYNTAGESCASSYTYATTGSSGSVPGSVSVNPSSGSWTYNQNLSVTSAGATTIYYKMVNTYDGSTPADPSYPSSSSNNGSLSGSSTTFSLYGSSGQLKKSKLRFVGCNNYGCGSISGVYSYSIDQRGTVSKPAAPGGLSATAASSSSINLRWSDLSNNESGFRPYRWNGSSWTSLGNLSANTTSYSNSGLSANTTYYYTVCSYNTAGESCPASYAQATTSSTSGGSSWDGKNPSGTACEQDASTVASKSNSYGKVELRWSNTCKTNWTRVVPNSSSYSTYGKIRRTSDQRSYTTSGTGTRFTAMVYAPTVQACASGTINGYTLSEVCR